MKATVTAPHLLADLPLYEGPEAAMAVYHAAAQEDELAALHLKHANLSEEGLEKLTLSGCRVEGCRLDRANLEGASFVDCAGWTCAAAGWRG